MGTRGREINTDDALKLVIALVQKCGNATHAPKSTLRIRPPARVEIAVWAHRANYSTTQAGRQQLAQELNAKGLIPTPAKQHFDGAKN